MDDIINILLERAYLAVSVAPHSAVADGRGPDDGHTVVNNQYLLCE